MTDRIGLASLLDKNGFGEAMTAVAERIASGAVFVYPTETIYGIGGRADSPAVEQRIRRVKDRKKSSPFILVAADLSCFKPLGLAFPPAAGRLARAFWPGNLTIVVPGPSGSEGIGIRVSDHPFVAALNARLKVPLFSTSANVSGSPYVNDPEAIFSAFRGEVDFMVDAGVLPDSLPSTVVNVAADNSITVLREGRIPAGRIMQTLQE